LERRHLGDLRGDLMGLFGKEWEPATGILIDTRYGGKHGDWSGNASRTVNSVHYLMEATPDSGGEPFRCECEEPPLIRFQAPPPGRKVRMECIPSKRKAKFDRHDPAISQKAQEAALRATYEAELHGGPKDPEEPRA
jgi:hypothetical protein